METINTIELNDASVFPDDSILKAVLGRSYTAYNELLRLYDANGLVYEWRYYKDGKAWLCKVQKKRKTIVWMSAWKGFLKAAIYIPEKHLDRIYALPILEATKERIRTTKNVGKSRPCIFEIRNQRVLKDMNVVMQFKIQTK